jgi:hypothetical protein
MVVPVVVVVVAGFIMRVIMVVAVQRKCSAGAGAEKGTVFRRG